MQEDEWGGKQEAFYKKTQLVFLLTSKQLKIKAQFAVNASNNQNKRNKHVLSII